MKIRLLLLASFLILSNITTIAQNLSLDWARQFSGSSNEFVYDIEIDDQGNIFTVGHFTNTVDFDPGAGVNSLTATGQFDGFIKKIDSNGDLVWVRQLTGGENLTGDLEIRNGFELLVIGQFRDSIDMNVPASGLPLYASGLQPIFTLTLDTNGNFLSADKYDGSRFLFSGKIASRDNFGPRWDIGYFQDTLFYQGNSYLAGTNATLKHATFLSNGSQINILKGSTQVNAGPAEISSGGSLLLAGTYAGKMYPPQGLPSTDTLISNSHLNYFLYKQDISGNPVWIKQVEGNAAVFPRRLIQDPRSSTSTRTPSILISGIFTKTIDFDPDTANTFTLSSRSVNPDVFLQKLDTSGNFIWAKSFGGTQGVGVGGIATNENGDIYVAGSFQDSVDFDPSTATANLFTNGGSNVFIVKLDGAGNFLWASSFGDTATADEPTGIEVRNNSLYLCGNFEGTIDFDPTSASSLLNAQNGSIDMFVVKFTDLTVGISEEFQESSLKLYPNPSPGLIKIDNRKDEWHRLDILDLQGRILFSRASLGQEIIDLQLSDLPNGTYLMRMEGDQMNTVQKFVVER